MSLKQEILTYIKHHNYITIAQFMKLALSHDEYGYYAKNNPLGRDGDFITAPEISQIFGELIGLWLATNWSEMGAPKNTILVELGAGRGTLMQDILRATSKIPDFHKSISIKIIEINQTLRDLQRQQLEQFNIPIGWHDEISSLPKSPMIFIANEFFDALPIHQFIKTPNGWRERVITLDKNDNLTFSMTNEATNQCLFAPQNYQQFPDDAIYEFSPQSNAIIEALSKHIAAYQGVGLIIDYGYYNNQLENSLQSVKDHKYHDILQNIGQADITAHVNFKHLANTALKAGAQAHIGVTQQEFLTKMGINIRAAMLKKKANPKLAKQIDIDIERLTSDTQMGRLFKTMAITHRDLSTPYAFENES